MLRKLSIVYVLLFFILCGCVEYDVVKKSEYDHQPISPFPSKDYFQISLYYPDKEMNMLRRETRVLQTSKENIEEIIIRELLKGTQKSTMRNIIPSDTKLLSIQEVDHIAYVSFSRELINDSFSEAEEVLVLFSIINSLSELDSILRVQILIEGEIMDEYNKFSLEESYSASSIIVGKEYVSPMNNIEKYYQMIQRKEYGNIAHLFSSNKKEDISRGFIKPYWYEEYSEMSSYQINDYNIRGYGNVFTIEVDMTIYYRGNIKKEDEIKLFEITYENEEFKIYDIVDASI